MYRSPAPHLSETGVVLSPVVVTPVMRCYALITEYLLFFCFINLPRVFEAAQVGSGMWRPDPVLVQTSANHFHQGTTHTTGRKDTVGKTDSEIRPFKQDYCSMKRYLGANS